MHRTASLVVVSSMLAARLAAAAGPEAVPATAEAIAAAVVAACPLAPPDDEGARQRCADELGRQPLLDAALDESFLWGGQSKAGVFDLGAHHLTRLDPFVWRRMYLSLFMFSGSPRVEQVGEATVIHLPGSFRYGLDPGSYPYPFWHSEKKWNSYQVATEVLLVMRDGKVRGGMRSFDRDEARPRVEHAWNGRWQWARGKEPRNTLYRALFSRSNPHVGRLEASYRRLEGVMRRHSCQRCHSPNNAMGMNPLELLSYPNQALTARGRIVEQIEANKMPPETDGDTAGIRSPAARRQALAAARAFERAASAALAYERARVRSAGGGGVTAAP